ncbi:carboxylesterase [Crassisporium funariophilum]|nr:carboxylesterase [Crassisporium funariophilum]
MSGTTHLHDELASNTARVTVNTAYGSVVGGRAINGAAVFLEVPYALPPGRFEDPVALPSDYQYEAKDCIRETLYGVQPTNDGQARDMLFQDKVGFGEPTETPLFLNIVVPPSYPQKRDFPVKVYIHGGFLQFGSPHSLSSQAQYVAAERSEIWVNIGYRLSAFGFLASDRPQLNGNYGFKDQWLALEWIKANIESFGGNPNDIQLTGLSAGAHSVHQILHHASQLPEGKQAPFHSAVMQSNAILTDPKTPAELRPQFDAFCRALHLDPDSPDILATLRDPVKVPWESMTTVIEDGTLGSHGTFRGCLADDWLSIMPGPMACQRSGDLARGLRAHGVKGVIIGDLIEEWYLYSIAHPINGPLDILPNLKRYFPAEVAENLLKAFPALPDDAAADEAVKLYGDIMSCGQVHLPVRMFARDMEAGGLPVLRYEIRWTPEQDRPLGYVTHGADRVLWALRTPNLEHDQLEVAKAWLDKITEEFVARVTGDSHRDSRFMITLKENKTIEWTKDGKWEALMELQEVLDKTSVSSMRSDL